MFNVRQWPGLVGVVAVSLLFFGLMSLPVQAGGKRQVVLIAAEGLSIDDINAANMPFLFALARRAASGLMNPKTAAGYSRENAYITLGAGRPAVAGRDGGLALGAGRELGGMAVARIYRARTGKNVANSSIVFLKLQDAREANVRQKSYAMPGLLGETLEQNGLIAAVIGNSDLLGEYHREAVAMVMDRWGRVAKGNVSREMLTAGETLLWRTDFEKLYRETLKYGDSDLLLVETGDLTRLELVKEDTLPRIWRRERKQALTRIDEFSRRIMEAPAFQGAVFVVFSHQPSRDALAVKNFFTPVIVAGTGLQGMLTSSTTRRPGIVTATDLTASIFHWLDIKPPAGITGRRFRAVPAAEPVDNLTALNRRAVFTYTARPPLVKGYILLQIIVIALALLGLFTRCRVTAYLKPVLLALTAVPVSLLLVVMVPTLDFGIYLSALLILIGVLVVAALVLAEDKLLAPFIFICLFTVVVIVADLLNNAALMKHSTLGYDPMAGARYYGIGNEYMGVLSGAAVIGTAALYQRLNTNVSRLLPLVTAVLFFLTAIIGAPQLGANFGGALASLSAFIFLIPGLLGIRLDRRTLPVAAGLVLLTATIFTAYDCQRPAVVQSHLGRMAQSVLDSGPKILLNVVYRKVAMNVKLIRWTIWSRVFLALLAALAVLSFRPVGIFRYISRQYPYFHRGLLAVIVGSGAALVFNDSGIVAAAMMMIFAAAPLVYIAISANEK